MVLQLLNKRYLWKIAYNGKSIGEVRAFEEPKV